MRLSLLPLAAGIVVVVAVAVGYVTCACQKRTVLTYDAGLRSTIPHYEKRRAAVADAIEKKSKGVDFMCLQEFWYEKDLSNLLNKRQIWFAYPYHYSAIHFKVGKLSPNPLAKRTIIIGLNRTPCPILDLAKLFLCYRWHCGSSESNTPCLIKKCGDAFFALSPDCRSCIAGLLILSKQPLTNVSYQSFHPGVGVVMERGYIQATTASGVTYVCTHMSSTYPYYYEAKLSNVSSFEQLQKNEIEQLQSKFDCDLNVLMGGINSGPAREHECFPKLQGELPKNYKLLTHDRDYRNPYLENDGRCTHCWTENALVRAQKVWPGNRAIDHVLISPTIEANFSSGQRVFDNPNTMLSDHYGVQLDICLP